MNSQNLSKQTGSKVTIEISKSLNLYMQQTTMWGAPMQTAIHVCTSVVRYVTHVNHQKITYGHKVGPMALNQLPKLLI